MKKIGMMVFLAITSVMILIPGLTMNRASGQASEFDNRMLYEFPAVRAGGFRKGLELYLSDRIRFREEMITVYQNFCNSVFRELEHPAYIKGKEGHVMVDWDLRTYQHLDVDENYVKNLTEYLKSLRDFCKSRGCDFLFFLSPNKETIYPEYYPDGYNVKAQPNRSDRIVEELTKAGVTFVDPRSRFSALKQELDLYNKKYDAGHWNDNGCFYGSQEIIKKLRSKYPAIGELRKEEFNIKYEIKEYLPRSHFTINEQVPFYELKECDSVQDKEIFSQLAPPENYHYFYKNMAPKSENMPKILIFGDSYFQDAAKFYRNHSSELTLLHSHNLENAEYYISVFQPDIVIVEAVERVLQVTDYMDDTRVEKRFYSVKQFHAGKVWDSGNLEVKEADSLYFHENIVIIQEDYQNQRFVTFNGNLGDKKSIMLSAMINKKEYFPNYDSETGDFSFSFRTNDLLDDKSIIFYFITEASVNQ